MSKSKHIHRYKKINLSRDGEYLVYKCSKPTCEHYIPIKLAEGKLCECNRCGEPMIIGKRQLNGSHGGPLALPHCNDCFKGKKDEEINAISKFISKKESTDTDLSEIPLGIAPTDDKD